MTPHEEMMELDEKGTAYVVCYIAFSNGDSQHGYFGVTSHSEKWMQLEHKGALSWVNMDHVVVLKLEVM